MSSEPYANAAAVTAVDAAAASVTVAELLTEAIVVDSTPPLGPAPWTVMTLPWSADVNATGAPEVVSPRPWRG